ncbi:MAG: glutamyl-tRNA reductase [Methanomassiliicoccaceae archaeon]|nr:glutamyl-tRNA reductase [Methanomassiliicoccaceae archaeon]
MIVSLHVTHTDAGVEAMSEVAQMMESNIAKYLHNTMGQNEYVILKTCNRFEVYVGTDDAEPVRREFESFIRNTVPRSKEQSVPFVNQGKASIRHLFRVSCGLDSLIVGEDHIQGQVREAYVRAKEEGHVSKYLSRLFDRALSIGKKVRNETQINSGSVSVGSAAVELAEQRAGGLEGKTVTVFGAGSMASAIGKSLSGKGARLVVVSGRTFERASDLALQIGGTALSREYLVSAVSKSDVLFVATSAPHIIVTPETVTSAGEREVPLLIVDVSVPKNVDDAVGELPGVSLETMDSLQGVAAENIMRRMTEISEAERIVRDEIARMDAEYLEEKANHVIGEIGRKAAAIREEELSKAKSRAASGDADVVLEDMSRAIVSKMLADVYENLRVSSAGGENGIIDAARYLFGLEVR